jgi:hypothetical protein
VHGGVRRAWLPVRLVNGDKVLKVSNQDFAGLNQFAGDTVKLTGNVKGRHDDRRENREGEVTQARDVLQEEACL